MLIASLWPQALTGVWKISEPASSTTTTDRGFIAVIKVDRDLPGEQFGGSPRVAFVAAIQPDRILQADAIGNIEMKNGHGGSSSGG